MRSLLLFVLCVPFGCFAQTERDSLESLLPHLENDSAKVKIYQKLFFKTFRSDLDTAMYYALEAEKLSKEIGYLRGLGNAKRFKSFAYSGLGEYDKATVEMDSALIIYQQVGDSILILDAMVESARITQDKGLYEESITAYLDALSLARSINNEDSEARIHNYLGGIYNTQKQYKQAIDSYSKALEIVRRNNIIRGVSACLTNLAAVYSNMGDNTKAVEFGKEALEIKRELKDVLGTARVLDNLANAHCRLGNYDQAEIYAQEASILAQQIGDPTLANNITNTQACIAFEKGDYQGAVSITREIEDRIGASTNLELQVKTYRRLYEAYGKLGQFEEAHSYGLLWQMMSDSVYNTQKLAITNELEAKYQNEQRSREIELLESEKELQELQLTQRENERNGIILISVVILIFAGLIYNQFRIKKKANKQLRELDKFKSNFFANISHEFRTPLTLIQGPIEQLEQNPEEPLEPDTLRMMRRNSGRLLSLVNQLLDLTKIDEGTLKLEPMEGDILKCLRTAASSFNSLAAQRNIDYRVSIPGRSLWTSFDRDKLEKILYNLLSNAFKFSTDGGIIEFNAVYKDGELQIQVSDYGRGIAAENIPHIFDRFYQVDSSSTRKQEGSGIGLSLSKDLVTLMDGTITVSSEEGKGSFFMVHIPIVEIETRQSSAQQTEEHSGMEQKAATKTFEFEDSERRDLPLILLVEDNPDMRAYIKGHLKKHYRVKEAFDGEEGLKLAMANPPDLIISDVMMPRLDGIELCKKLKTNIATSHIPIIMLTARVGIDNKIEGLETGADEYLAKPFQITELSARIKNLIDQRKKLREFFAKNSMHNLPEDMNLTSADQRFLDKVFELLEEHYTDSSFGVPQMQSELGMSNTQLYRKIKALTGERPGELLRNYRLKKAAYYLNQNADTVTQIAYQVGFNNLSYFAKCFKSLYGIAPSSYSPQYSQNRA